MSVNHQIDGGSGEIKAVDDGEEDSSKQKKQIGYGRKAKKVVFSRIKKAKKRLQRSKTEENGKSRSSGSSCCCCLYIRRIPTVDSSSESPTSDPNSSEFGFDQLKGLIENSDFFLSECNTHFDVYTPDDLD